MANFNYSNQDIKKWSVDQTAEWLVREGYGDFTAGFISREINGSKLLELQEFQLRYIFRNKELERQFWTKLKNISTPQTGRQGIHLSNGRTSANNHEMLGHHGGRHSNYPPVTPGRLNNNPPVRPALPPQRPQGGGGGPPRNTNYPRHHPPQPNPFQQMQHGFPNDDDDDDDEWDDDSDDPTLYHNDERPPPPPRDDLYLQMDSFKHYDRTGFNNGASVFNHRPPPDPTLGRASYSFTPISMSTSPPLVGHPPHPGPMNYTKCIPRSERSPEPFPACQERRPVELPSRPAYGPPGGDYRQPQNAAPHWSSARPPMGLPETSNMYLPIDNPHSQNEFGRGIPQIPPSRAVPQRDQPYPLPGHPPVVPFRPPQAGPGNHPHHNNFDDQEAYEPPIGGGSPHDYPRRPPPIPDSSSKRPDRSPIPSPSGPLSRDNSSGSSSGGRRGGSTNSNTSQASSSDVQDIESPKRGITDAFQKIKPPVNAFSAPGFPPRSPQPLSKSPCKQLPMMRAPNPPEKPDKSKAMLSNFKTKKPPPLPKPSTNQTKPHRNSFPSANEVHANLANIIGRVNVNHLPGFKESSPAENNRETRTHRSASATVVPAAKAPLESQSWYKNVDRDSAKRQINGNPHEGCFIVRPGTNTEYPYSMTVYSQEKLYNLRIRIRSDKNYAFGKEKENERAFPTVVDLIEYYMYSSLIIADGKGSVVLTSPP